MKIYAPVKNANGVYASVRFVNGVGETDNPRLIEWFSSHGYTIEGLEKCKNSSHILYEKCDETPVIPSKNVEDEEEPEMMGYNDKKSEKPDFEKMTPYELREWAIANGYNVRNTRNKEKLLEILRG